MESFLSQKQGLHNFFSYKTCFFVKKGTVFVKLNHTIDKTIVSMTRNLCTFAAVLLLVVGFFSFHSWAYHYHTADSFWLRSGSGTLGYSYLLRYKDLAIREMRRTGIPASITLAQGMYESGFGKSDLALKGNNHFGIKCKNNWQGATIAYTDDAPNECFRKYKSVYESYIDHSNFLKERPHYRFLFNLPTTNYRAWAEGLKRAGYATDPNYSSKIIAIIQRFRLYEYDEDMIPNNSDDRILVETKPMPTSEDTWVVSNLEREYMAEAALYGAPIITPTYRNKLHQIDAMLTETLQNRPAEEPPRVLSGEPVIFVGKNTLEQLTHPTPPVHIPTSQNTISAIEPATSSETSTTINTEIAVAPTTTINNTAIVPAKPNAPAPVLPNTESTANSAANQAIGAEIQANTAIVQKNKEHQAVSLLTTTPTKVQVRPILKVNNANAVRYNHVVSLRQVAKTYQIFLPDLLTFNEINNPNTNIPAGTYIYLSAKRARYAGEHKQHIVQKDETMWDIAQKYGLTLAELYERNAMRDHTQPLNGEAILLKGKADYPPKVRRNTTTESVQENTPTTAKTVFRQTSMLETNEIMPENSNKKMTYHLVKSHETLQSIAEQYYTNAELITEANNLSSKHRLKTGEILLIITY